jgi:hypothetical protein
MMAAPPPVPIDTTEVAPALAMLLRDALLDLAESVGLPLAGLVVPVPSGLQVAHPLWVAAVAAGGLLEFTAASPALAWRLTGTRWTGAGDAFVLGPARNRSRRRL